MERRERELALGLHPDGLKDPEFGGGLACELEKRRLADARLAPKHQDATVTVAYTV
jgi:hypothetical protein